MKNNILTREEFLNKVYEITSDINFQVQELEIEILQERIRELVREGFLKVNEIRDFNEMIVERKLNDLEMAKKNWPSYKKEKDEKV